jgi:hypothetical protein
VPLRIDPRSSGVYWPALVYVLGGSGNSDCTRARAGFFGCSGTVACGGGYRGGAGCQLGSAAGGGNQKWSGASSAVCFATCARTARVSGLISCTGFPGWWTYVRRVPVPVSAIRYSSSTSSRCRLLLPMVAPRGQTLHLLACCPHLLAEGVHVSQVGQALQSSSRLYRVR